MLTAKEKGKCQHYYVVAVTFHFLLFIAPSATGYMPVTAKNPSGWDFIN
jgi:hypothetical protein